MKGPRTGRRRKPKKLIAKRITKTHTIARIQTSFHPKGAGAKEGEVFPVDGGWTWLSYPDPAVADPYPHRIHDSKQAAEEDRSKWIERQRERPWKWNDAVFIDLVSTDEGWWGATRDLFLKNHGTNLRLLL